MPLKIWSLLDATSMPLQSINVLFSSPPPLPQLPSAVVMSDHRPALIQAGTGDYAREHQVGSFAMPGRSSGGIRHKSTRAGEWSIPDLESQELHSQTMESPQEEKLRASPPSGAGFPVVAGKALKLGRSLPQSPN